MVLEATGTSKDIEDATASDINFSSAQDARTLEMAPATPSTLRNRIDETLEMGTPQTSLATYFTQPLKQVEADQGIPEPGGHTPAASSKPNLAAAAAAPTAPKNNVIHPNSTVELNVQSKSSESTAHDTSRQTDSPASATVSGLLLDTPGTEMSTRHPFESPSQTPSADPDHQRSKSNQEKASPGTSAGIAIGTISLAAFAGLAVFWAFLRYKRQGKSCENIGKTTWTGSLVTSFKGVFQQSAKWPFKRSRGVSEAKISAPFAQQNSLNWS